MKVEIILSWYDEDMRFHSRSYVDLAKAQTDAFFLNESPTNHFVELVARYSYE